MMIRSFRVIGLDKRPPEPGTLWQREAADLPAHLLQLDLSDEAQIYGLPARLKDELAVEQVHCLVNNAGIAGIAV